MSALLHQVQQQAVEQLLQSATLPADACFRFDVAREGSWDAGLQAAAPTGSVQKTVRRTVVSLQHGPFQACETVRQAAADGPPPGRSAQLAGIVAPGARYGYDLIAHVGLETYLRGRRLQDLQRQLALGQLLDLCLLYCQSSPRQAA